MSPDANASGQPEVEWVDLDNVVSILELDVDPNDHTALLKVLRDGMKREQRSPDYARWVSAYKFTKGLLNTTSSIQATSVLPYASPQAPVAIFSGSIEERSERARIRASTSIRVRARRWNIGVGLISCAVAGVWGLQDTTHPLLRKISPYQLSDGGVHFNNVAVALWLLILLVLIALWVAALFRRWHESNIVEDAHDFIYQAQVLSALSVKGSRTFTQADYETQLLDRRPRDYNALHDDINNDAPALGWRILGSIAIVIGQVTLMFLAVASEADNFYEIDSSFSLTTFLAILGELVLSTLLLLLWARRSDRASLAALLQFYPAQETVMQTIREGAQLGLERFVERGTIYVVRDRGFLPTYAFDMPSAEGLAADDVTVGTVKRSLERNL